MDECTHCKELKCPKCSSNKLRHGKSSIDTNGTEYHEQTCLNCQNRFIDIKMPRAAFNELMEFKNLNELLKPDTAEVKAIKTLLDREEEYAGILGPIESAAANLFLDNRQLTDKQVVAALEQIKADYGKDIGFFKGLAMEIMASVSCALQECPITNHEFKLALDYVRWCVDNRSWIGDKQAYLKWICYTFGFFEDKDAVAYERDFRKKAQRMGVPKKQIDALLNRPEDLPSTNESVRLESEFFAMSEDAKIDFLSKQGVKDPYIFESYVDELISKGKWQDIETLCSKTLHNYPELFPVELLLAKAYVAQGKNELAHKNYNKALDVLKQLPEGTIPAQECEKLRKDIEKKMSSVNIN